MSEFFSQGGYALYVWGSYGMALVLLVAEIVQLTRQRRTILTRIGRILRMRAAEENNR
jgi:heme exporter protein D